MGCQMALRAPEVMATASEFGRAALSYARRGWQVFPCLPGSKKPATLHGVHNATLDEPAILQWWQENPSFNIAVATGAASGFWALDIDQNEQTREFGRDTLEELEHRHGLLPVTVAQRTPTGGAHLLFHCDGAI